jgi:hypothetical protein
MTNEDVIDLHNRVKMGWVPREEWPQGKNFARRMPGENDANGACWLYADVHLIEPHHLPISPALGAGKRNRTPAITNGGISIVVPDLAIGISPADHDPFGTHPSVRRRCRGKGEQHPA